MMHKLGLKKGVSLGWMVLLAFVLVFSKGCTEVVFPSQEEVACSADASCLTDTQPESSKEEPIEPPRIEPPAELPKLGDVCSKDTDCGTGLICVLESEGNGHCFQDCSPAPLDCQKNTDGRTVCLRNEKEQRYCFQPKAKDGQRCGAGMQNDCDKDGEIPLYCNTKTWTCEKVSRSEKAGDTCDLAQGKGCLAGLSCLTSDSPPNRRSVCYLPCGGELPSDVCQKVGLPACGWVVHDPFFPRHCHGENVDEGGACGGSSPYTCKSWLSLYCDESTKTCKKAPSHGTVGEDCKPSALGDGCAEGLLCLKGKCTRTCKEEPSLCATGERCEADYRGVWSCFPAKQGETCQPSQTKCEKEFACDYRSKRCALPSIPSAQLGQPCSGSEEIIAEGLACISTYDTSLSGAYRQYAWMQTCEDDPSMCAKNTDGRTNCYTLSAGSFSSHLITAKVCIRLDAKEGEACGSHAQALCEDDDTSRHPKLVCVQDVCKRPTIQQKEGEPCDGPFLDATGSLVSSDGPSFCDRDAAVPLVCDIKTHTCIKAGIVGEGQPCLGDTGNLCAKGLVCHFSKLRNPFPSYVGVCLPSCDVRNSQCPQGTSCKRQSWIAPKSHVNVCTKD
ncbi:MAG: hypothetical protein H6727_18060 [Myxococcales bacterium]|nr:hypothetical protein [Myxococcales bacterium]